MSEHCGFVVQLQQIDKHPNADRLQIATIFGAAVIVDLKAKVGDLGVYFPIDLQLSPEYCEHNNLVRKKDENGNNIGGYLDPHKRNIRAMRFRGSPSEGLFMPLESLKYTGATKFEVGDKIEIVNGHEICRKYIPNVNYTNSSTPTGNKTRKKKVPVAPLFAEHADTEQLAYNLSAFRPGDLIEITLKMHGTSARTGYLPKLQGYKRTLLDKILRREGTPIYDWGYVTGTRRVVLNDFDKGGFYGDNAFREQHARLFEGKLHKGETVYYEIVGFTTTGSPIMAEVANNKISDKEFTKQYGKTTTFSYGCVPNPSCGTWYDKDVTQSVCYVYRMTMTNEDGDIVEYSPDYMRYRCEQMGVKYVPVLWKGYIPQKHFIDKEIIKEEPFGEPTVYAVSQEEEVNAGEYIKDIAEQFYDGPDPIGKIHVREGVVVRIVNKPRFCAYKHKNFNFKVLSGIAADLASENGLVDIMDEDRLAEL